MSETPDNVVELAKAFDKPSKKVKPQKSKKGSGEPPFVPPPSIDHLPPDAPVKALGKKGRTYFFLDSLGQFLAYQASEIGRLEILGLFGGRSYLVEHWPAYNKDGFTGDFRHGDIGPVLIQACTQQGLWEPLHYVRGPGTWAEDDGTLVMHCGEYLWAGDERLRTGLRGRYLYPRSAALPEPLFDGDPAGRLLEQLETWSWVRPDADPRLMLGWIVASLLGQAQPWRPMLWVTGGKGRGKSTLLKLAEWVIGKSALISVAETTKAGVYQTIGDSALPVALDEFEAKSDNRRAQEIIELARIAASGGDVARGGADGRSMRFTLRNCFLFSSILIPPLAPADRSRMAILELLPLRRPELELEFDPEKAGDQDVILGNRDEWAKVGRELRGRIIEQWHRYPATFQTYRHALIVAGHETRAAEQFGALGAAFDIAMYDSLQMDAAKEWAALLPARSLAETTGYLSEPEACMQHLLASMPDLFRSGARETVSHYLRQAREDTERNALTNDPSDANRVLAKLGVRLWRDRRDPTLWWIGISSTHEALGEIFARTHWKGMPGAPGTWAQALRNLPGAGEPTRLRIDGVRHWVTPLHWDAVFPPYDAAGDQDESEMVDVRDQDVTVKRRGSRQ